MEGPLKAWEAWVQIAAVVLVLRAEAAPVGVGVQRNEEVEVGLSSQCHEVLRAIGE